MQEEDEIWGLVVDQLLRGVTSAPCQTVWQLRHCGTVSASASSLHSPTGSNVPALSTVLTDWLVAISSTASPGYASHVRACSYRETVSKPAGMNEAHSGGFGSYAASIMNVPQTVNHRCVVEEVYQSGELHAILGVEFTSCLTGLSMERGNGALHAIRTLQELQSDMDLDSDREHEEYGIKRLHSVGV
ncbi:hypothetical protein BDZ89DRAFT_1150145 [Hymenopellis radicata]|nr:hypothetical protein BDZ89DRAFT_1150145 [Hymenopellis radicata]